MKHPILVFFIMVMVVGMSETLGQSFSRQDSLRGSVTAERAWWNLTFYHLDIQVDPVKKSIQGKNTIHYQVIDSHQVLQVDLQDPMRVEKFIQEGRTLKYIQEGNVYFVKLQKPQKKGELQQLEVVYGGIPKVSVNPPWTGGITWKKDANGFPFIANSNQGDGASLWWPCKDHMYDEPDSMLISVRVPDPLINVSNGRLRDVEKHDDQTSTYHWHVENPINNYGVNISIADYAHFSEVYQGEKGPLTMDYFVLRENLEKATTHFKDAPKMMRAFEYWFGPYPFYEDGFKLIEVPYLGMEHQSAVTYGNKYLKGYLGKDFSKTGWGLTFDYIIIHEAGHEWFANNITYKDIADMWIHESFTTYSEGLFIDYHYGKQAGNEYIVGARQVIKNDIPIIGSYGVNKRGSGDMYFKGANILHTLRQWINDDEKWRKILREMNVEFYHQTVTTNEIEQFLIDRSGLPLEAFFDQYLRDIRIPTLEWKWENEGLMYRWTSVVDGFYMPLKIMQGNQVFWIHPIKEWQRSTRMNASQTFKIDANFYILNKESK